MCPTDEAMCLSPMSSGNAWEDNQQVMGALRRLSSAAPGIRVTRAYRPTPTAAFSRADSNRRGFHAAISTAATWGYTPLIRPAGGKAVLYDDACIILDIISSSRAETPVDDFAVVADGIAEVLRASGCDARVGAVAGEYCPGTFSVNLGGRVKVAGIAQRVLRHASLVSAVVMVGHTAHVRAAVEEVYAALEYDWDPATFGAVVDEVEAIDIDRLAEGLVDRFAPVTAKRIASVVAL